MSEAVNSSLEDEANDSANLYQVPPSIVLLLSIFYGIHFNLLNVKVTQFDSSAGNKVKKQGEKFLIDIFTFLWN